MTGNSRESGSKSEKKQRGQGEKTYARFSGDSSRQSSHVVGLGDHDLVIPAALAQSCANVDLFPHIYDGLALLRPAGLSILLIVVVVIVFIETIAISRPRPKVTFCILASLVIVISVVVLDVLGV